MKVTHAHIPGKGPVDQRAFALYVRRVVRRGKAQSFNTTESYRPLLLAILRTLMPGWSIVDTGEYLLGVKRTTFATTRWSSLRRYSFVYDDADEWRDVFGGRRRVAHRKTKRPCVPAGAHAPSHVELGDRYRPNTQSVAHQAGIKRLGQQFARIETRSPTAALWCGIDSNVDHHRPVWRERMETGLEMPSCWTDERPTGGTHRGGRLIDAIYSNVPMSNQRISGVRRPVGVDHRAVLTDLDLGPAA